MKNKTFFFTSILLFIIINVFAKNKDIYNINYSDGKKVYCLTGARIICSPGSLISIKGNNINLTKGRIWVTTGKKTFIKIIQNNNSIEINGATVDLNSADNLLSVFNGDVYVFGKRIGRGQVIDLKNKKIDFIKNPDEWQKQNIEMETISVLTEIQGKKEIKEMFEKTLTGIIKNNYRIVSDNEPEFLVRISISETGNKANGTIVHVSSGQITGIIDEKTEEKNPAEINAINTGSRIFDIINFYTENELYNGRIIIIETTDLKSADFDAFRKMLLKISGSKILEEKNYYNIKNIFKMSYAGNGYDLAEIIKNHKISNKKINIYYISKYNLKIKIQN